jgi:hypothetical protein
MALVILSVIPPASTTTRYQLDGTPDLTCEDGTDQDTTDGREASHICRCAGVRKRWDSNAHRDRPGPSGPVRNPSSAGGSGGAGGRSATLRPAPPGAVREHAVSRGAGEG